MATEFDVEKLKALLKRTTGTICINCGNEDISFEELEACCNGYCPCDNDD